MPVRLRYLAHDLEVPQGQFVIGRSAECQLSLDDPLVSRRHALLTVQDDWIEVRDLGSRNGVSVNGVTIRGAHRCADGDKVKIGSQEMTLSIAQSDASPRRITRRQPTLTTDQIMQRSSLHDDDNEECTGLTVLATDSPKSPDKRVHSLALIGGVAEKALAMGHADDAEKLLQRPLDEILEKARGTESISPELADRAVGYAVRLAGETGNGRWVDYSIALFRVLNRPLPSSIVDELYRILRKVKAFDLALLREYVADLRDNSGSYGPAERFLLQRIEGLERLAALK